jgi:hypothetical protein
MLSALAAPDKMRTPAHSKLPSPLGYTLLGKGSYSFGSMDDGPPHHAGINGGTLAMPP